MHLFVLMSLLILFAPQRVRIGDNPTIPNGVITPPRVLSFTQPFYTRAARDNRIEGTVTVEAEFDVNGNPNVLRTVKSLGYGLDENALTALHSWKFSPALRNSVPVEVVAQVDIDFLLATAPPAEFDDAIKVGAGVSAPTVLKRVEPRYTDEARAAGLQGTVILQAIIGTDGSAKVAKVVKPMEMGLTESATEAIEQWKFKPAVRNGKEVAVAVNIEINFNLAKKK
jgi:TonB family protein